MLGDSEDDTRLRMEMSQRLTFAGFTVPTDLLHSNGDWWDVIARTAPSRGSTANPYWDCFDVVEPLMNDHEYAVTVRELWVAHGLPRQDAQRRLEEHGRVLTRDMWMTAEENAAFTALPETVVVFRGCARGDESGFCWTTRRDEAEQFAAKAAGVDQSQPVVVVVGKVRKDDIFALFSGEWDEGEVVILGDRVIIEPDESTVN